MSSDEKPNRLPLIFSIIIFLFVTFFYFAYIFRNTIACIGQNGTICVLKQTVLKLPNSSVKGTYLRYLGDAVNVVVSWSQDAESQEIVMKDRAGVETMHLIEMKKYMYLKDYSDSRWWRQKATQLNTNGVTLSFEPKEFFQIVQELVRNPENEFLMKGQDVCGNSVCTVYSATKKINGAFNFYLDPKTKILKKITRINNNQKEVIDITFTNDTINPPINAIKDAKSSQNLFMELQFQKSNSPLNRPNYLQEFEKTVQEQQSSDIPIVLSPTP